MDSTGESGVTDFKVDLRGLEMIKRKRLRGAFKAAHVCRLQKVMGLDRKRLPSIVLASKIVESRGDKQPREMTKEVAKRIIYEHMKLTGVIASRQTKKVECGGCYVYIIQQQGGGNFIKIGKARDVDKRVKALQTASPYSLTILARINADNDAHALCMEKAFHERLRKYSVSGEWFKPEAMIVMSRANLMPK
jgi:hypothetical protein